MSGEPVPRILWTPQREYTETDCACPGVGFAPAISCSSPSKQIESECAYSTSYTTLGGTEKAMDTLWKVPAQLSRIPLRDTYELIFNPTNPIRMAVLNKPALRFLQAFDVPHPLTNTTEHRLASLGLLAPVCGAEFEILSSQPRTLTVWLQVTNACNLNCAYCYVHKSQEAMDEKIGQTTLDTVFHSAHINGFHAVKLKYAGGEPTLKWSTVCTLHTRAKVLAQEYGLRLQAVVLSNGTVLTDEMIDWLRSENVRIMISLDGVGAVHDAQRRLANGRGSFAQVAHNVDHSLNHGLAPHLSITITAHNANHLPETVAFALKRDLPFNLNLVRQPTTNAHDWQANQAVVVNGMKAALAVIEAALPRRRLIDALVDRSFFSVPHTHTCGAGRSYLVVDHRGDVSRCQMTMDHPVTDIWVDDPLQQVRKWRGGFQNIRVDEKEGCRACIWRYWCAGGCPLLAYRTTGRSDVSSPYCAVYRALYPEVLRLEGLRLLKLSSSSM